MDTCYELSKDIIERFNEIFQQKSIPTNIKFKFIGYSKQKTLINVSKISDKYQFLTNGELLVCINEELYDKFDDISIEILFNQEIDKISVNIDNGKITFVKPDLTTFSGIVNKYGIKEVSRANQIVELTNSQTEDQKSEGFLA